MKRCSTCGGKAIKYGLRTKCAACGTQIGKTIRTPKQITHSGLKRGWKSKTAKRKMP